MVLTTTTRTNLHYTPAIYEHWHHRRSAYRAIQGAVKFHFTMRANKAHHRACGNVKLASEIVAAVQTGKSQPALLAARRYSYKY